MKSYLTDLHDPDMEDRCAAEVPVETGGRTDACLRNGGILMRELYYHICLNMPEKLRDFLNRLIPGLILEPVRVKAPVGRPQERERRRYF